jgi:hypothetical protein
MKKVRFAGQTGYGRTMREALIQIIGSDFLIECEGEDNISFYYGLQLIALRRELSFCEKAERVKNKVWNKLLIDVAKAY